MDKNKKVEILENGDIKIEFTETIIVRKCQNCGEYFYPSYRSDEKYCDRTSPQDPDKTCKEYGARAAYRKTFESSPIKQIHKKLCQKYHNRVKRAKNDEVKAKNKNFYDNYMKQYKEKQKEYKEGKISEEDLLRWLHDS